MSGHQASLFDYQGRVIAPRAPEGVKRAAVAGGRVDEVVLAIAAKHAGKGEIPKAKFWAEVNEIVTCEPDTPRRRLVAMEDEGLVTLATPSKLGHILIVSVP